jgi:predicted dinucleotide-binding enzyme
MGSALAGAFARAGRRTLVHDLQMESLQRKIGHILSAHPQAEVEIACSAREASWEADIIIPAVPYQAQSAVAAEIRDVVTRKIVISLCNPIREQLDALLTPTSAAEELARLLPHSRIVKTFNTVSAADIEHPVVQGMQLDCFVAGNDREAVSTVCRLVQEIGLHPVTAGDLSASRILEAMTLIVMRIARHCKLGERVGWKILTAP